MKPRARSILGNLALAGLSLFLFAAILEVALRCFYPQNVRELGGKGRYLPHPVLGHVLNPGHVENFARGEFSSRFEINDAGRRAPETAAAADDWTVLGLGDSFVFGWGVDGDEVFLRILERSLRQDGAGARARILNAAVPAYGALHYPAAFEEALKETRPALVLLSWCLANDVHETLDLARKRAKPSVPGGEKKRDSRTPLFVRLKHFLGERSHAYCFVADRLKHSPRFRPWLVRLRLSRYDPADALLESTRIYRRAKSEKSREAWDLAHQALLDLKAKTDRERIPLVLFVIPTNFVVERDRWKQMKEQFGLEEPDFDFEAPVRQLREISQKNGIIFINPTDDFRRAADAGERLYYRYDPHWNADGHRLAARVLAREIERLRLIPRPGA